MTGNCDRCGEETKEFWGMGNMSDTPTQVCRSCHDYWFTHYISLLDKMHLDPDRWHRKWKELYAEFLSFGKKREKVMFT
jgi:hypothetical protein